jgi:integrase
VVDCPGLLEGGDPPGADEERPAPGGPDERRLLPRPSRPEPKGSGRVFKTRYIKTAYNNAVEAAQLDDVTFHTLRHTFASWAIMRGVTLKELQELQGHSSLAMTMRYAHLAPEHLRTAVSRLEGLTSTEPTKELAPELAQEPVETGEASQN